MTRLAALVSACLIATPGQATPPNRLNRPIVVELFTSQGCSSCPPADHLLVELADRPDILALAFHVTYWNNLGWRDPFSLDDATTRQRDYQRRLGSDTIYTPQMIIDGSTDVVGSDRAGVTRALQAARAEAGSAVALDVTRTATGLNIVASNGAGEGRLLLLGYDPRHVTAVARGENAGAHLTEANIVRSVQVLSEWQGARLSLNAPLPTGARIAVLLQGRNGRMLGAATLAPDAAFGR